MSVVIIALSQVGASIKGRPRRLPAAATSRAPVPRNYRFSGSDSRYGLWADGLYIATSVDGFIATEDGSVDWLEEFQSEPPDDGDGGYEAFFETVDALVMGARTYEQVRSFGEWPYGDRPTYVLTRRAHEPDVESVEFVNDDVASLGVRLEERYGRIWLVGGGEIARAFLMARQVDALRLNVVPLLLGGGVRLFGENGVRERLETTDSTTRANGIVELQYRVH